LSFFQNLRVVTDTVKPLYSMPVNIATTQGAITIPTKSAATRRLCIERSPCSAGARGGADDPSRISPWGYLAHSTSAIPLLHFCVSVRSGLATTGQAHVSKIFLRISQQIRMSSPLRPEKSPNSIKTVQIKVSRSWHTSFPPSHIIKTVSKTKQTRPAAGSLHLTLNRRDEVQTLSRPVQT
jgi:hypothetical protein